MSLMQEVENAMVAMYDAGQQNSYQYDQLARARSGLLSEPEGSPGYDRYATTARNNLPNSSPMATSNDPAFGGARCDCAPGEPCCMTALTIGCSHGTPRLALPVAEGEEARVVVVCDRSGQGGVTDEIKIELERTPRDDCGMTGQRPLIRLLGRGVNERFDSDSVSYHLAHPATRAFEGSDLAKFIEATRLALWGDLEELGESYSLRLMTCTGTSEFDARLIAFPKVEWACEGFDYDIRGRFYSNGTFETGIEFTGKLSGTFGNSEFTVGAQGGPEPVREADSRSVIPFINRAVERLGSSTSGGASRSNNTTYSYIQFNHKVAMGDSRFSLAEHPDDPAKVGISGQITMGFQPLFGIKFSLDVIDVILTAANGPAPGLAQAIRRAREHAAKGVGSRDGPAQASAHAAITLKADGRIGEGGVTLTREVGEDRWQGSGNVGGSVGLALAGTVRAQFRAYFVTGAASAEGRGTSRVSADFRTLPERDQENGSKKFGCKVEWDGLTISYQAQGRIGIGRSMGASGQSSGSLQVLDKETLYDETF